MKYEVNKCEQSKKQNKTEQKNPKKALFKMYFLSPLSEVNVFLFAAG